MTSEGPLSGENRGLSCFAQLTHLLSHRSLNELLADALALLINTFQASGGSMLYASSLIKRVRQGSLSAAAQSQVDYLEEVALARAQRGARQIQLPSTPPVTKHVLSDLQGALFSVPLINRDRARGVVTLFMPPSLDLDHQQRQDISLLVGSISAIASAVEQLEINRLRLSQLGLFYQMGQAMTSTFDTGRLFEDTIDLALAVIDARHAALMLLDQERQQLRIVVRRGDEAPSPIEWVRVGQGVAGWVAEHGEPVLLNDVSRDGRFDAAVDGLQQRVVRSLICVPLQIKGRVIGILHVLNKRAPFEFDEEDLSLLITLGAQVSIAIDNARLYNSLRAERDRIIEVQESTRHELARNLHDGPVQLLAAIAMQLEYLERLIQIKPEAAQEELNALRKLARQATQDARMLLFELRPVILETQGLIPALQSYVERLSEHERFAPHFDPGNFEDRLNVSVAATIFSIVQEAINNIEKHAKADNVWIRLREQDGELIVFVEDDGKGFNVDSVIAAYDQGSSFGLLNMKERAELIDGVITMESGPKRGKPGTLVQLRVPLTSAQEPVDV
jgi:signal transduction histidine kinase